MIRWTPEQLEEYMARRPRKGKTQNVGEFLEHNFHLDTPEEPDKGPESVLQSKIVRWCRDWARPVLSFRQSVKARGFITPGWPDMTIAMPGGRTLWLELKAEKGVVKEDQRAIHLQLMALGHEVHVVKSYRRFLEIVNGATQ